MKKLLILSFIVFGLKDIQAQIPNYVPQNGLIAWYPFTGNSDNENGTGNNGTPVGASLTTDRFGSNASAYSFDGVDDYIEMSDAAVPSNIYNGMTISFWFKAVEETTTDERHWIIQKYDVAGNNPIGFNVFLTDVATNTNDGTVGCLRTSLRGEGSTESNNVISAQPYDNDEWHHGAMVWDAPNLLQYVDGELIGSVSTTNTSFDQPNDVITVGCLKSPYFSDPAPGLTEHFFNGKIDDIGIWSRALSSCEIEGVYSSGSITIPNPVVTAGGPTEFCQGDNVDLTASSADSYLWSNGATDQTLTVTQTGSYSVTLTNGNTCSATSTSTAVTVNDLPTPSLSAFTDACQNAGLIALTGGSPVGGSYTVNGNIETSLNPVQTGAGSQTIGYNYTDGNGCTGTASQSIMVNAVQPVTLSGLNGSYTLSDLPSQLVGTPAGGVFGGTGVVNGEFDPAEAGLGTHNVMYATVDGNGCISMDGLCTQVDLNVGIGGAEDYSNSGNDLFPNPSDGLHFTGDTSMDVKIYDVDGRLVRSYGMTKSVNNQLNAGIYLVTLGDGNHVLTRRLVVTR